MRIDPTLDCADAVTLADFWKLALGYEDEPPPAPFATREEWAASFLAEDETDEGGGAWLRDPAGVGPRLCLLDVPEGKVAKNLLHMDVRVGGWAAVTRTVALLRDAGAAVVASSPGTTWS